MLPTVRALAIIPFLLAPPLAAQDSPPYTLRPGDRVTVDVFAEAGGAASEYAINTIQIPSDQSQVRLVRDGTTMIVNIRPDEITPAVIDMRVHSGDWINVPARRRSRVRDELTFWGSVVSFATGVATLIILATTSR